MRATRTALCTVLLAALASTPPPEPRAAAAQSAPARAATRVSADELMRVVRELAQPRYEGRGADTAGGRAARAFVQAAFTSIGLEPAGTSGFEQPFQFTRGDGGGRTEHRGANLVGVVKGTTASAAAIVITAHYDHLGIRNGRTYPGADDNASGVAALLAIARYVKMHPLRRPVVFAAFDAEEVGLEGAKAFVAQPPRPIREMAINVNLDMVSRSARNEIFAAGTHHSPWLRPVLDDVQRRAAVRIRFGHDRPTDGKDDWTLQSDHGAFHRAGVPFVYFGVEDHPDYHAPTDTPEKIDAVFFRNVVEMVLETVLALDRALERARDR